MEEAQALRIIERRKISFNNGELYLKIEVADHLLFRCPKKLALFIPPTATIQDTIALIGRKISRGASSEHEETDMINFGLFIAPDMEEPNEVKSPKNLSLSSILTPWKKKKKTVLERLDKSVELPNQKSLQDLGIGTEVSEKIFSNPFSPLSF
jgi:hypothetical protein